MRASVSNILQRWEQGKSPTSSDYRALFALESQAWETMQQDIKARSHLFISLLPTVKECCNDLGFQPADILKTFWHLWLPLALQLHTQKKKLARPFIQGILGAQGTGKTTLTQILSLILQHLGNSSLSLSLDDLYKTYAERQQLQASDPRLIWRGPPGTHDVTLGLDILQQLRQANRTQPIEIPRFDKSAYGGAGDRTAPEKIERVDIVFFEGWFVGMRPLPQAVFETPPPPITTSEDKAFARDMNQQLCAYLPLWDCLDALIILLPQDYQFSKQWRREAEQKMKATGKSGMIDEEINAFVEYFWKALHPELYLPPLIPKANLVIEINRDHSPQNIYSNPSQFSRGSSS